MHGVRYSHLRSMNLYDTRHSNSESPTDHNCIYGICPPFVEVGISAVCVCSYLHLQQHLTMPSITLATERTEPLPVDCRTVDPVFYPSLHARSFPFTDAGKPRSYCKHTLTSTGPSPVMYGSGTAPGLFSFTRLTPLFFSVWVTLSSGSIYVCQSFLPSFVPLIFLFLLVCRSLVVSLHSKSTKPCREGSIS